MKLHLDFETRSEVDLKKVGAWAYAMHESTDVLCLSWGVRADRIESLNTAGLKSGWRIGVTGGPSRHNLVEDLADDTVFSAHNAPFEYAIYNLILHKRYGWPAIWEPARWTCTMARAAACGLPLSLDELTRVLGCKTPKDLEGRSVMLKLSRPIGYDALGDAYYDNDPAKLERLYDYNRNDVVSEMEVDELLPELPASEREIWGLDLIINRRGIAVDLEFCQRAAELSERLVVPLNERLRQVTGGAVDKATRIQAFKGFLTQHGVEVPYRYVSGEKKETLDKVGVTELLERPDLPPAVRQAVEIRRQVSKTTSTAKYAKALEMVCPDGRVRGSLQYHGAHTGRWAGRLLQAHNFPQGFDESAQLAAVGAVLTGSPEMFAALYGDRSLEALSDALRGMIVAAPGKVLISSDYNAIEARVVFWLAGEAGALATYRAGGSPYLEMGEYIYRKKITKKGDPREYDIAKRTVLGCGFGMGWEKFRDNIYAETAKKGAPVKIPDELAQRAVSGYRAKYPGVPRMWREIETTAIAAVQNPSVRYPSCGGKILWGMSQDRRFLCCKLPSGRYLWYWKPEVIRGYRIFCKDPECVHWKEMDDAKCPTRREQLMLAFWGKHPKTGEWMKLTTYGGALTENVVQAVARDIMAHGMLKAEGAGFEMLLTVHDELLAEIPELEPAAPRRWDLETFQKIMCDLPPWAAGLPVAAEGWVARRYRK